MKKLLLILLFLSSAIVKAQQFNNEWIDYAKTYYKFKVGATGLYRISQSQIASMGWATADVQHFQLWRNGVQVPLFTSVQSGALPAAGFVEFWGEMNDGKPDLELYRQPEYQLSNTKSLFTDTAAYFLTINSASANRRLTPVNNVIPSGATPEPFFSYTAGEYFNEQLHMGTPYGEGADAVYPASFEDGEGWASNDLTNGASRAFTKANLFVYTGSGAPEPKVTLHIMGNTYGSKNGKLTLNSSLLFDQKITNYQFFKLSKTIPLSLISGNTADFVVSNVASNVSRMRVALVEMEYPRLFNFGGASSFRFQLPAKATGTYLEIAGFNGSGTPVIYDLQNGTRYEVNASNPSLLKVFLQPTTRAQDLVLVNQDGASIKSVNSFEPRNFVNYSETALQGDYLIITHSALLTGANNSQPVEEYRAYRSSATGGGFNAKIYRIEQLVDQFSFGIKQNPLAIRNFLRWARARFTAPPRLVFLVGKGIDFYSARLNESLPETEKLNLIPTFGYPASDVLLTAEGSSSQPLTPIGRVSVVNGNELQIYLNKVKEYEQQQGTTSPIVGPNIWKKNAAHIVGANDQYTIDLLYYYLNIDKKIIEDTLSGYNVSDFVKSFSGAAEKTSAERLVSRMNDGINFLSYFGHSSSTTLAFNIENPENYVNPGRYPIFNMMGCNVGNIFWQSNLRLTAPETISEKYLLAKDRGCIAMMAGTSLGYVSPLAFYNQKFYSNLASNYYGADLGTLMQQTIKQVFQNVPENSNLSQRIQCEEFTLNGDPAIRVYYFEKPDYAIEDPMVKIAPNFISVAETEFTVDARLYNIGKAINKKLVIELKRAYPDLSTEVIRRDTIAATRYTDSLRYSVPINPTKDKGMNKITITIDPDNLIDELYKSNNSITKEVFIYEDDLRPIFPYDNSIVNKQNIIFSASTANPLAGSQNYVMELDTTRLFSSPTKFTQTKSSVGGLIEYSLPITFKDSTVYYWRVGMQPQNGGSPVNWNYASFIYLTGNETGFNESNYYQFNQAQTMGIKMNANHEFVYDSLRNSITINNAIYPYANSTVYFSLQIGEIYLQRGFVTSPTTNPQMNSLRFYLVNNKTLEPVENVDKGTTGLYGSYRPLPWNAPAVMGFFQFDLSTTNARKTVMDFLDSIPTGFYVGMTSSQWNPTILPSVWQSDTSVFGRNKSLYHKLKSMGFSSIDSITSQVPYIFIFQKDNPAPFAQVVADQESDILSAKIFVPFPKASGAFESLRFKKAKAWNRLDWDGYSQENPSTDKATLSVIGVNSSGAETTLMPDLPIELKTADLSSIDAKTYPELKIRLNVTDSTNRTPYQLKYWRVFGNLAPEGAIAPNIYFSKKDTVQAGEPLNLGIAFKNVSPYPFDSVKVKLAVRDRKNVENIIPVPNQKSLIAGDTIKFNFPIATPTFTGSNTIYLDFNPDNQQPEQIRTNNFIYSDFFVRSDTTQPFLDVTFDGVRILNRDIVSSKPDILIKLTDDSKWLLLNDPGLVKVQLRHPDGSLKDYQYNTDTLRFNAPVTSNANTATINFRPDLPVDGNYELIIAAKDQSGNLAGELQYRVGFQVLNKPMISNMLNYPNPFTTSTAFVFTLTGSEVPQNLRIQIMTITGKIVKEITKAELGPIRIGRNITEYKWDGTDQFGQKLANGVYLYRVITNLNGKSLEKYKSESDNTDRYFKAGYGKMYLMR